MKLYPGFRGYISGDAAAIGIEDYNVRVSSPIEVLEAPNDGDEDVLVRIDSIDGDTDVTTYVHRSAIKRRQDEAGICPVCGKRVDVIVSGNGLGTWNCKSCDSTGLSIYEIRFSSHVVLHNGFAQQEGDNHAE